MLFRVSIDIHCGASALVSPVMRYELIERLAQCAARLEARLLAFGLGDHGMRVVLECPEPTVGRVSRGFKVGTVRAALRLGVHLSWYTPQRFQVEEADLAEAVAWAHRAPVEDGSASSAIASPWSSHRDLLGFRIAGFYNAEVLLDRVDVDAVRRFAEGRAVPTSPVDGPINDSLHQLLRVAAGVLGVLPADRRCFRLFVHLAKARGWQTSFVAEALTLTSRRIRQLAQEEEPLLPTAVRVLHDARLCRVP